MFNVGQKFIMLDRQQKRVMYFSKFKGGIHFDSTYFRRWS